MKEEVPVKYYVLSALVLALIILICLGVLYMAVDELLGNVGESLQALECDFACKLDRVEEYTTQCNALEQYAPDECRSMAIAEVFGNGMEEGN